MTSKLAETKNAIVLLMEAQAPCTVREICREVDQQAYPSMMPQALHELQQGGFMVYNEVDECFDLA